MAFSFNDILRSIDPTANDEVSREFLRIIGADPQLMRELALQQVYQQNPYTAAWNPAMAVVAPGWMPTGRTMSEKTKQAIATQIAATSQHAPAPKPATPGTAATGGYRQKLEEMLNSIPAFTQPPAPTPIPAPPQLPMPPKPMSAVETLEPPPVVPEPNLHATAADFLPGLVAALFSQDALPYIAQGIEQGLQQREQREMNRYQRALQNAMQQWQAKRQAQMMDMEAQRAYQQAVYQTQVQNMMAPYQTQLQNIQQQNQYAQQAWASQQDYNQWAYGQKLGLLGRLAEREATAEQREYDRQLREELKNDQMAMQSFNILMNYVGKPTLTAAERQSALKLADSLAEQFPRFKPMFEGMKSSIQTKPSVPELNLQERMREAQERLRQGWERIGIMKRRLAMQSSASGAGLKPTDLQRIVANRRADLNAIRQDIRTLERRRKDYDIWVAVSKDDNRAVRYFQNAAAELDRQIAELRNLEAEAARQVREAEQMYERRVLGGGQKPPATPPRAQPKQQPAETGWRDIGGGIRVRVVK